MHPNDAGNRSAAIDFLELAAAGRVDEAFDRHVAPEFTHHNPWFAGDAASLQAGMREAARKSPAKEFTVQRAIADANLVAVHSKIRMQGHPVIAVVHILRFDGGRIVEMWDVGQPEPESPVNSNGMF